MLDKEVVDFIREHNLPVDLQEAIEAISFDAKEKIIKLLIDRGVIGGVS